MKIYIIIWGCFFVVGLLWGAYLTRKVPFFPTPRWRHVGKPVALAYMKGETMGILDAIKGKADDLDKTYNPLRKVGDAIEAAGKNIGKPPDPQAAYEAKEKAMNAKTPQQAAYEAKEKYMNRNNPGYVPRAKGGPVKAGGAPMKNVDNSGMTKMKMGKC